MIHGHVGAVDAIARALLAASALIEDGRVDQIRGDRYAGWKGELGQAIMARESSLASIADLAVQKDLRPAHRSGSQERLENLVNRFVADAR
jgi:xylose isomerase